MNNNKVIISLFMAVALMSCSTKKQHPVQNLKEENLIASSETGYIRNDSTKELPFWGSLFTTVCKKNNNENICISPLSAQFALSMTATGATGETLQQMYDAMGLTGDVNAAAKETLEKLADNRNECEVNIANSIWINEKLDVKQSFIDTNKEFFNALVTTAPFNRETLQAINNWCSENTKGKIKSALADIKNNDRMYLINALYFKGGWEDEFNANKTKEKPFTKEDGSVVKVPMMQQKIKRSYYEDSMIQVVTKPFKGMFDMQVVLPAEGVSIEEATAHLAGNYKNILGEMSVCDVTLSMPKFQSEFGTSLKDPLQEMGMQRAFSNAAQLDGISDESLKIDDVFQKTFIKVDEKGAEAAAVTVIRVGLLSMNRQLEKKTMNLDRPFIYLITNSYQYENILFIGKVGNPNEQ